MHQIKTMLFVPLSLVFLSISYALDLSNILPKSLENAHNYCLNYTHFGDSIAYNLRQALICGKKLPQNELKTIFINSGLLHLLVISGAHLNSLELIISKIMFRFPKGQKWVTYASFIVLNIFCQLQAPCLRAFFQKLIHDLNIKHKLFLSPLHEVMYAGILCLCLLPIMTLSHSLILSWWISLILKIPIKQNLHKCILIYLSLIPWQLTFMKLPVQSILLNWILAPALALCLMPLALIETLFPFVHEYTLIFWHFIINLLKFAGSSLDSSFIDIPIAFFWLYLLIFQLYLIRKSLCRTYKSFFT